MAKTNHLNSYSDFTLSEEIGEDLGTPVEEIKKRDFSTLSMALMRKGEFRLLNGDRLGLEYFDMAAKLDPKNSTLFLQQGLALFEYGSHEGNEEGLTLASKRFKVATLLNPNLFQAWHLWGNTLYFLGNRKREPSYFSHALKKYERALELSKGQECDVLADLQWDLGDLWAKLAKTSGEVTDYHYAIEAYEKASSLQNDLPTEFWMNFGKVNLKMGVQTNDTRFLIKAITCFKNGVSITISNHKGWHLLGSAMKTLYSYTHEEDHFSQANECFKTAVQLSGKDPHLWRDWARLMLESGVLFKDLKKLRAAVDKCYKAHQIKRKDSATILLWAEVLAQLGMITETLPPIHEALNKIEPLGGEDASPDVLYVYGLCLSALGHYYKDIDITYQATEKFQEGLSKDRTHYPLWRAMALNTLASAQLDHDEKSFERSCHFFDRALTLKKESAVHFEYGKCLLKFGELIQDQTTFEDAVFHLEEAIAMQKNASYIHPEWIFHYACALDHAAEFLESNSYYLKAIDLLGHVMMVRPEYPQIHYQLALTYGHYGELVHDPEMFGRALHHFRIAHQKEKENDHIILDWALTLLNLADLLENDVESDQHFREAEYKMIQAAKLGNLNAYYALACLYSLIGDLENSLRFLEKGRTFDCLPSRDEILEDEWLENLRQTEGFQTFIEHLAEK